MTLRKSATVLRVLVGLALSFGFVGFATHSLAPHHSPVATAQLAHLPATVAL